MITNGCPDRQGLYDPAHEHDACGTGFVANLSGERSHQILELAIQSVVNLTHRGAIDADAKTGDGAGILTQIPQTLFAKALRREGITAVPHRGDLAVGMLFLPPESSAFTACRAIIERVLREYAVPLLLWREVPVDHSVLGEKAAVTCPAIYQVLMARPASVPADVFERRLYLIRREIENAVDREQITGFYVPSFSSRTVVYKGLFVAPQLSRFYLDLRDADFDTALAVFHQRYSTNTFPTWPLAQPFRYLAHNGEINTLQGNRNWMRAREPELRSSLWGAQVQKLLPIIQAGGSDSTSLDNALELLEQSGRDVLHALMMLVPEAWQNMPGMDPVLKAFFQYHAYLMEPWDGPAALAFTDGSIVGATLDRNGLRPARYVVTKDGLVIMASEAGVIEVDEARVIEKGRLGPGRMIAVDTARGVLLHNDEIKQTYAHTQPYGEWVRKHLKPLEHFLTSHEIAEPPADPVELLRRQVAFGYTNEELEMVIAPMAHEGKEPVWSMGDDIPLAVLSPRPRFFEMYFKQLFAQVTNPPIDPLREHLVMSLGTIIGPRHSILEETEEHTRLIRLSSPMLLSHEFEALRSLDDAAFKVSVIPMTFIGEHNAPPQPHDLERSLQGVCEAVSRAIDDGAAIIILSDRTMSATRAPIPSLLAIGAVHHDLIRRGKRMRASIILECGDMHDIHGFATLIGYGASAVHPYLAYESVANLVESGDLKNIDVPTAIKNFKKAADYGLLKIMSKMGISTVGSYRGAQIFEAVGLGPELIERCFTGTASRIGGIGFEELAGDILHWHAIAFGPEMPKELEVGGLYKYRRDNEYHAYNPEMIKHCQDAIKRNDYETYKKYAAAVNHRPPTALRDLLEFMSDRPPIPVDEVEPIEAIAKRFATASISYGALSKEAHETIAIAMNRLGAKSGSGEGGEDPARYHPTDPRMNAASAIKQVASGRFGVTPEYLLAARELEIKMAQGSKPGEGGQLPGHKVSEEIARVRHTPAGITLISPPPHHDIYSIEDIAQLIYDLKQINTQARVTVKLVSEVGVGTIAAGVAKAHADTVLISGHDGGTGASPLSSIKHAGLPWELGLSETQQTLVLNGLREKILVRADGGMKTGRDILIAAMLGAEEYGFGTMAAVATGCVMTRQCHLNTCPVGVATQDERLRARFKGTPEMVENFFRFVAREVRELLAGLGYRSLEELIGCVDLLTRKALPAEQNPKIAKVDLGLILKNPDPQHTSPRFHLLARNDRVGDVPLDLSIIQDAQSAIEGKRSVTLRYPVRNIHRSVGTRLSGEIAKRYGDRGLPDEVTVDVTLEGTAGQSFGAFLVRGVRLTLEGDANDYVGKGMAGGEIILRPSKKAKFATQENVILGNTVMYGATGGSLYAAGQAGERFCVRNSGGNAVVEGLGDHGCEYMTGGVVVVLGETGRNFGAGMTGGKAYVLDEAGHFEKRYNTELIAIQRVDAPEEIALLREYVERHAELTGSSHAKAILARWRHYLPLFWLAAPKAAPAKLEKQVAGKS